MKKLFTVVMAVAFVLSVAGFAVAADNAAKAPAKAAAPAAAPAGEKKAEKAAKPKSHEVTGTIEALDAAAGTFTVKGKKGNVDLKAGDKVKLDDFKVGDKVYVKYSDGKATSMKAKPASKKAEPKPAEKKAPAPAAAPIPAPTPAPAPAPAPAAPPAKK